MKYSLVLNTLDVFLFCVHEIRQEHYSVNQVGLEMVYRLTANSLPDKPSQFEKACYNSKTSSITT